MDISQKETAFTKDLDDAIAETILFSVFASIETTDFSVTTMTVMLSTGDKSYTDLNKIIDNASTYFPDTLHIRKSSQGFFNCIMCSYTSGEENTKMRHKGIKVFSNGQLHITGVRSIIQAFECGRVVYSATDACLNISSTTITDFTIQMINGHFKFIIGKHQFIKLSKLHELCIKHTTYMTRYFPENHAGLFVRLPKDTDIGHSVTVVFFESGSVLINAFTTGNQLRLAFEFAVSFMEEHITSVLGTLAKCNTPEKNKRVRRSADTGGFDYGKYLVLK